MTLDNDVEMEAEKSIVETEENLPVIDMEDDGIVLPSYEEAIDYAISVSGNLVEKEELLKVPFVIHDYEFRIGDVAIAMTTDSKGKAVHDTKITQKYYGLHTTEDGEIISEGPFREYVIVRAVTAPGHLRTPATNDVEEQVVFTDGGVGIYKTLGELFQKRGVVRVNCRRGLRVSRYTGPQGGDSETWYL